MYAITKTGIAANLSITRAALQKIRKMNFKDVALIHGNAKIIVKEPIPSHTQCFDVFPCSWYIDGNLKLRGNKIENGFKFGENLSTKN